MLDIDNYTRYLVNSHLSFILFMLNFISNVTKNKTYLTFL